MDIEYDAAKSKINEKKHGVSLDRFVDLDWAGAMIVEDGRADYGEPRYVVVAELEGRLHVGCFTLRNDDRTYRVISLRKANKREQKVFYGN